MMLMNVPYEVERLFKLGVIQHQYINTKNKIYGTVTKNSMKTTNNESHTNTILYILYTSKKCPSMKKK